MTVLPKKLNNNPVNTSISTLLPICADKPDELHTKQFWEPLKKQIIDDLQPIDDLATDGTATHDTKIAALHAIKQKFMPKEITVLPWDKYKSADTTIATIETEKKQKQQRYGSQYDQIMQDLALSHARVAAAEFEILGIVEADKLVKKTSQLKKQLDDMYEQLRVHVRTTRATVKSLHLSTPHNTELAQLKDHVCQTEQELEEFYFMNKYANHVETRHLQHLAGTLLDCRTSKDTQLVCANTKEYKEKHGFLSILHLLREILDGEYNDGPNSSSVSLSTSISSSSSSSAASSLYNTMSGLPADEILQQINIVIEKISQKAKLQKETIRLFEVQCKNADTREELMKQRERSAELVLQLEKNRSQRFIVSNEKELTVTKLKEQLIKENSLRKSLQSRVAILEQEIEGKERLVDSYDLELKNLKDQSDSDKHKIRHLEKELDTNQGKVDEELLEKLKQEKTVWLTMQKRILNQYSTVIHDESCKDLEEATTQLVKKCNENEELLNRFQKSLKEAQSCMQYQQGIIDQLSVEKESFLETSEKVINKCVAEINDRVELNKTGLEEVVEETIQLLKREHTIKASSEEERAEEYRIKHSKSLLKIKQQELMQLQERCDSAIKIYTTRESAYILQSASTEAELEKLLKEYDRLTRNITDFNSERKKFEDEVRKLQVEKVELSRQLCDKDIINIYGNDSVLRKEFRDLMATVKEKHKQELLKEIDARLKIEHLLREKMSEKESKRWERVDIAVQTHLQLL